MSIRLSLYTIRVPKIVPKIVFLFPRLFVLFLYCPFFVITKSEYRSFSHIYTSNCSLVSSFVFFFRFPYAQTPTHSTPFTTPSSLSLPPFSLPFPHLLCVTSVAPLSPLLPPPLPLHAIITRCSSQWHHSNFSYSPAYDELVQAYVCLHFGTRMCIKMHKL